MSELRDRFLCLSTKQLQQGPRLFLPVPLAVQQLQPKESVSSGEIKPCGFCGLINPWFYPDTQRKAIWATLVVICVCLQVNKAISWDQLLIATSAICERFFLSLSVPELFHSYTLSLALFRGGVCKLIYLAEVGFLLNICRPTLTP